MPRDHRASRKPSFHKRRLAEEMADPAFEVEYDRQSRVIAAIDALINGLESLRVEQGWSTAELARACDHDPATVRRLASKGRPKLGTVVAVADALDADVVVIPRVRDTER